MVAAAKSLAVVREQVRQRPNLSVVQMDAARLGFARCFDAAFSNAALHWVQNQPGVLQGVARSLKPGGRLLFQMGGRGNAAQIKASMDAVRERAGWRDYFQGFVFPFRFPGEDDYTKLIQEAGLRPRRVELIPKDMQHAGREGLAGWLRTTWLPYLQRLPEDRRQAFLDEVVEEYLREHPLDAQGTAHVGMVRLEVEAETE
jgi:trans-aconitate 2-methyltransferase